jgi:hypothetical protein
VDSKRDPLVFSGTVALVLDHQRERVSGDSYICNARSAA